MERDFDKALIFTDLHITPPGRTIIGLDPLARFAEGLAHALGWHPDARHLILLGDLTHDGAPEAYARLADLLAPCPIPLTLTLGNHDDRAAFADAFPDAARTAEGFAQTALDLGRLRLLILDTLDDDGRAPMEHDGWLCDARLAWLVAELDRAEAERRDVVVACHHPPFATGFFAMDAIGLGNASDLLSRLDRRHVKHLICGHIHRTIHLSVGGLPASVLKSPCHQIPLRLGPGGVRDSVDEPGAYGLLLALDDSTIALHTEDFALGTGAVQTYA